MFLKSIQLKNIRSYLDEKIEFPSGSTLLSGDVGSGKSTVLLAMDFALFGLRKGELEGSDLLRHGKNSGSVELSFEVDGKDFTIVRTLKRSKDSVVQDTGIVEVSGYRKELMATEIKSKVFEIFGYSQEKKNRPVFRYTVYTPQEKMKEILFDEDLRLATLRKIFAVDKYGQIKANTKLFVSELRSMKRENEAFSLDLEQKLAEKEEKVAERGRVIVLLDKYSGEINVLEQMIEKKEAEFEKLKKKMHEVAAVRRELTRVESEIRLKSSRLPKVEKNLKDIGEKISLLHPAENISKAGLKEETEDLELKREKTVSEQAVVMSELSRLNAVLKGGICSFCGQKVNDRRDFQKHIDEKNRIIDELKKNAEFASVKISKLKEQISIAEKIEYERKLLDEYQQQRTQLEIEQKALAADVTALRDELVILSRRNEEEIEALFSSVQSEIGALNKSRTELEKLRSRCEQQLYDIDKFLTAAEREIEEKRKSREKIAYIQELIGWFDANFVTLMDIIEKHVLAALQQIFNEFFQKWFGLIMGEQFTVQVSETFSPLIEQNGYVTQYENLSGGEKTAVALAYRLALNRVINSIIDTIRTKDILILDEPTDGFSSEQLDRLKDVLAELQLNQIILVSHEPKIDTFVDNVIRIYKEDHVSKVVY